MPRTSARPAADDPRFRVDPDAPAPAAAAPAGRQLRSTSAGDSVSGVVRDWQQQLARLERLQQQLAGLETMAAEHREACARELQPLQQRRREMAVKLVHGLVRQLDNKALSERQRAVARERVCDLAAQLADEGDAGMRTLYDRFSPRSWQDRREDAAQALRLRLEAQLGEVLMLDEGRLSPERVWRAAQERLQQARQARREQRQARGKAKASRRRQQDASAEEPSPDALAGVVLRRLYRQLASALHPDRETDPVQRQRKTALMGQANAAYERRDLLALMQLQGQQVTLAGDAGPEAERRLQAMTALLRQQVADRERERAARQTELAWAFDLPPGGVARQPDLQIHLRAQVAQAQAAIVALQRDLDRLDDLAALRRWLNTPGD